IGKNASPERALQARGPLMSQSLVRNVVHLVYSTKRRGRSIHIMHRDGLYAYQAGIFKAWDSPALVIGGVADHVDALFALSKNHALKAVGTNEPRALPWANLFRPLRATHMTVQPYTTLYRSQSERMQALKGRYKRAAR